jgi:alanyl-tRNA synthetase
LRDSLSGKAAVVALVAVIDDKPALMISANDLAQKAGARAGDLVRIASGILGGGGGGKADLAQGGGTDQTRIPEALKALTESLS